MHCIAKVRSEDKVRKTVFTSTYAYRHGYYDFVEREFRGFARVEQLDTEDFEHFSLNDARNVVEEQFHQPPVRTVSWFHTGAFLGGKRILHQCREEYFQNISFNECELPEPLLPAGLSVEEAIEAARACKGLPLRSEVYADDGSDRSPLPYAASQSAFEVGLVQPRGENRFASFLIVPAESVSYGYDRNPADPRVSQSFVLETDELGNAVKSASVVYPRVARPADTPDKVWEEQNKMHISYGETDFTNDIDTTAVYRLRAGYESRAYEIGGIVQPANFFLQKEDLKNQIATAAPILFEEEFDGSTQKRLLSHGRMYFMNDAFTGARPLGELSPLGIGHGSHQLAFTKNLLPKYYGARVTDAMLTDAKYLHSEGDAHWWVPSGEAIFANDPKTNFYTPIGGRDLYGNESFVEYDAYTLLPQSTTDALGNQALATNDYRTLSPLLLTDANGNRAAVETDALGMVVKSAVMGKAGSTDGDTLADPTVRLEYDLFNWQNSGQPNYVHTFAREKHGAANPRWQESYTYSDGGGGVVMVKSQTNPGIAKRWNPLTQALEEVPADPRWIGNGRTIVNNKGLPIKQFEPYFSTTHAFESEDALVETGMTALLYYDPLGRNIRTELPDGTFTKVTFDAWHFQSFDANDTVRDSQWYADRGSPDPLAAEPADPEQRAAWLAARHHDTPATVHSDFLGRPFYAVADYGSGKTSAVFSESDAAGRYTKAHDQLGRLVSEGYVNMLGQAIYGKSAEKGENWVFTDAMGRLVKLWDNDVREFRTTYDALHRPVSTFFKEGNTETLFGRIVYGDLFPEAEATARNIKGRVYQVFDQAGAITITNVDFKGNATAAERRLTGEYKQTIDWQVLDGIQDIAAIQTAAAPLLETEVFSSSTTLDALGRPVTVALPDGTVVQPTYHEGNGLTSLPVQFRGAGAFVNFLESQEYDAKGQRQSARFGNGALTRYFYDPQTFRLTNLVTTPDAAANPNEAFQNLKYTFDPTGNITEIRDDAQQTHFFNNAVVFPESKFEYDALYQLTKATGREHAGLGGDVQRSHPDLPAISQLPHQNDATAVRAYTENYEYDLLGNITRQQHIATNANWNQRYQYAYQTNPADLTNRLAATNAPGDADGVFSSNAYAYDFHGNMTQMPHLNQMAWNFMDQLQEVDLGGGGKAYYTYGLGGNRSRKVIERIGGKRLERLYLGAVEIYRERQGNGAPTLERYTLHISDNTGKIAQVDTKTIDTNNSDPVNALNQNTVRYQYGNHLGSATLEADEAGQVISYEEYHPFGTSAYRVGRPDKDLSLKRYRFSGKERDDETGLYYFGARYYAAWLGRWTSTDPAGFVSGFNLYRYCSNNPVMFHDPNGMEERLSVPTPESLRNETDPAKYSAGLRALGYNFTGYNPDGTEAVPDESGRGHGLAKRVGINWDVGTWLQDMTPSSEDADGEPTAGPAVGSDNSPIEVEINLAPETIEANPEIAAQNTIEGGIQAARNGSVPEAGNTLPRTLRSQTTPRTFTPGDSLPGPYNLWSGGVDSSGGWPPRIIPDSGITDATRAPGFIMEDTAFESAADDLARRLGHADRFDVPYDSNPGSDFDRVWKPASRDLSVRAGTSQIPVESHGLNTHPNPARTVQVTEEIPTIRKFGGAMAGLSFLSGGLAIYSGSQIDGPVGGAAIAGGATEIAGAGTYTAGLTRLGTGSASAGLMGAGRVMMGVGGGVAAVAVNGYQAIQDFSQGNFGWGVVNTVGAIAGGVMIAAALGFTAPVWGTVAAVVAIGVGIAGLARWLFS